MLDFLKKDEIEDVLFLICRFVFEDVCVLVEFVVVVLL